MQEETTQPQQDSTEKQFTKPPITADGIVAAMQRTFEALETRYLVTEANVRGALHQLVANLNK